MTRIFLLIQILPLWAHLLIAVMLLALVSMALNELGLRPKLPRVAGFERFAARGRATGDEAEGQGEDIRPSRHALHRPTTHPKPQPGRHSLPTPTPRDEVLFWGGVGVLCAVTVLRGPMVLLQVLPLAFLVFYVLGFFARGRRVQETILALFQRPAH